MKYNKKKMKDATKRIKCWLNAFVEANKKERVSMSVDSVPYFEEAPLCIYERMPHYDVDSMDALLDLGYGLIDDEMEFIPNKVSGKGSERFFMIRPIDSEGCFQYRCIELHFIDDEKIKVDSYGVDHTFDLMYECLFKETGVYSLPVKLDIHVEDSEPNYYSTVPIEATEYYYGQLCSYLSDSAIYIAEGRIQDTMQASEAKHSVKIVKEFNGEIDLFDDLVHWSIIERIFEREMSPDLFSILFVRCSDDPLSELFTPKNENELNHMLNYFNISINPYVKEYGPEVISLSIIEDYLMMAISLESKYSYMVFFEKPETIGELATTVLDNISNLDIEEQIALNEKFKEERKNE